MTNDRPYRGLFGALPPPKPDWLDGLFPPAPTQHQNLLGLLSNDKGPQGLFSYLDNLPPADPGLGDLLAGLGPMSGGNALSGRPSGFGFGSRPMTEPYNAFRPAPAPAPNLPPLSPTPHTSYLPDVRRRTFFSFHFFDSFRVNQVRQSWRIRPKSKDPRAPLWFHDSSIWEKAKLTNDKALERLILSGLDRTSVTCILAGEFTWWREWVRFEIGSSVRRGSGLLTVYIHGLECPNNGFCEPGLNPLDFMGVYMKPNGSFYLCEKADDGRWVQYDKITSPVAWPKYLPRVQGANIAQPLSAGALAYDYKLQDGYANMSAWIQAVAVRAGK